MTLLGGKTYGELHERLGTKEGEKDICKMAKSMRGKFIKDEVDRRLVKVEGLRTYGHIALTCVQRWKWGHCARVELL
jgi:hypothetical protein